MQATRVTSDVSVSFNSAGMKKGNMKNWKMTDEMKEKVIACAKVDAANGSYWGKGVTALQNNELEKVAPNRTGLMSRAMMLQAKHHTTLSEFTSKPKGTVHDWFEKMVGSGFGGETIESDGPNIHIYDDHGYEILTYDSFNGWKEKQSYEETQVYTSFKDVYYEAFRAEETVINANSGWRSRISSEGIDVQV